MSARDATGLRKIAEGREAEMFAWENGKILRLLRNRDGQRQNEWQAAAMEAARSHGVRVPAVHELVTVDGRPGMVMERLEGTDLLTLIGRRPWAVFLAGRVSGEAHAQMHAVPASGAMPPLRPVLRRRIESTPELSDRLRSFALQALDGLPDGDRLCHGDFNPANIIMVGNTPVIIDWNNVTRGEPEADVARTRMMLRLGEPPPGISFPLRMMALVGRNLLLTLYLRSYHKVRPLDMAAVKHWEIPVAAARLSEGISEEVPRLLALLDRAAGKA